MRGLFKKLKPRTDRPARVVCFCFLGDNKFFLLPYFTEAKGGGYRPIYSAFAWVYVYAQLDTMKDVKNVYNYVRVRT